MKNFKEFFQNKNWFYTALILFAVSLPLSESFISISAGLLFIFSVYRSFKNNSWHQNRSLILLIAAIYLLFIISFFTSSNHKLSAYDLKKNLVFLVIPVAFYLGGEISSIQKRKVLGYFSLAVIISALFALLNYLIIKPEGLFTIHGAGFISHIRFSFMLILSFWILIYFVKSNVTLQYRWRIILYSSAGFILFFIFYQQSLTGIVAFLFSVFIFLILQAFKLTGWKKTTVLVGLAIIIIAPPAYLGIAIKKFYSIEKVYPETIEKFTPRGNPYYHDFNSPLVENGHFLDIYICEVEMREEWNKLSAIKYDSIINEYPLRFNLMRYLTSRGLRKDADGIRALDKKDIENVEHGYSNYIFAGQKFSLYPRIYQTIWEYYMFSKTGYVNYQSFSQRLEFLKAAATIVRQNFLFGVGTGEWKNAFRDAFIKNGSQLKPELYGSSHNQYLNYQVKFGIVGLLFILFCIVYPIVKTRKYNDQLFLIFLLFMAVANLGDSNFESHVGGAFFVFFYCIFLTGSDNRYLKTENENNPGTDRFNL